MSDLRPWDRQPGESRKAFHAFTHYLELPTYQRSQSRAYTAHRKRCAPLANDPETVRDNQWEPTKLWKGWKHAWNWDGRADAHDAEVAEQSRLDKLKAREEMNERQAAIATAVQGKVITRLNGIDANTLSHGQLIVWLREATAIERRARGEATEIVKHVEEKPAVDISALSEEELDQFEHLLAKTQRGTRPEGGAHE